MTFEQIIGFYLDLDDARATPETVALLLHELGRMIDTRGTVLIVACIGKLMAERAGDHPEEWREVWLRHVETLRSAAERLHIDSRRAAREEEKK